MSVAITKLPVVLPGDESMSFGFGGRQMPWSLVELL